jgi:hypothetical protein
MADFVCCQAYAPANPPVQLAIRGLDTLAFAGLARLDHQPGARLCQVSVAARLGKPYRRGVPPDEVNDVPANPNDGVGRQPGVEAGDVEPCDSCMQTEVASIDQILAIDPGVAIFRGGGGDELAMAHPKLG